MNLIDTHSHLYLPEFNSDRREVIKRARENQVSKIFLPNIDSSTLPSLYNMENDYPDYCYPMAGLHPTSVKENYQEELDLVEKQLKKHAIFGIGEVGIDLYWDQTYREEQVIAFRHQVQLSLAYQLPVIIHVRNSFTEIFKVLEEFKTNSSLRGIFHSFTGTIEEGKKAIGMGFFLGINGIVTFKNAGLVAVVQKLGPQNLVLETDAPYLAPAPKRGKRNESAFIRFTAKKLSEILSINEERIANITTDNALRVFGLNPSSK